MPFVGSPSRRQIARPGLVADDLWWRIGLVTVAPLLRAGLRVRFHGLQRIPKQGGAILAPNHISVLDPVVLALAPSEIGRTIRFLAAAEFFEPRRHMVAFGLRKFGQIPVRRGMADRGALEEIASVIRGGSLAGIFPEGHMGSGPELQPGHKGVARVALTAGVPVLPVAIWGTNHRWPRHEFQWRPPLRPTVSILVGHPLESVGDARNRQDVREFTDRIMREIAALMPFVVAEAGRPAAAGDGRAATPGTPAG
jgi:1-acyl-sn-glycerol-3-phosphate acyltransferase